MGPVTTALKAIGMLPPRLVNFVTSVRLGAGANRNRRESVENGGEPRVNRNALGEQAPAERQEESGIIGP